MNNKKETSPASWRNRKNSGDFKDTLVEQWKDHKGDPIIPLKYQQKFYPAANVWMWNYCKCLGCFTYDGKHYDLGVYVNWRAKEGCSWAVVYDNEPGSYLSGPIEREPTNPVLIETLRRAKLSGYISNFFI